MPDDRLTPSALRTALVTGAGGFIGRALVGRLETRDVRTEAFDLPARAVHGIEPLDLADADRTRSVIRCAAERLGEMPAVFHLAGFANASVCRADPPGAFVANVVATANVLEACRLAGVTRMIFPSTALVYALPAHLPIDELAPVLPRSIYAASKIAAEAMLAGYAADYAFSIDVARLGNVYGPGGPADSVASTLLRQVLGDGRVHLRTLAPVRDFVHRDDVAEALIRLAEAGDEPGARTFNVSSGVPTSIGELAELAARAVGHAQPAIETEPGTRREDQIALDIRRLRERTGWTPETPLLDGLLQTLASIREEVR